MKYLFLLFFMSFNLFAATSGTLLLSGNVPQILSLEVNGNTTAQTLDLSTTQTDLVVGTVTVDSNSQTGYQVTISSLNSGKLTHTSNDFVEYTTKIDGSSVVTDGSVAFSDTNTATGVEKDISIGYTGTPFSELHEGDYSDELTFTITAQ